MRGDQLSGVQLSSDVRLEADAYVFACGPWLGELFPDILAGLIQPTRQEVFFFGVPSGDHRYDEGQLPTWIDNGERLMYGIPGSEHRGFKVADDTRGPAFDPTSGERQASSEGIERARKYMEFRFPGMRGAPLLESRVCQYENSPDHHLIIDRHPEIKNVWLVGGGSGHGFKYSPAVGEHVASMVLEGRPPEPFFSLARFS